MSNIGTQTICFTDLRETIKVGNYSSIASGCYFHEINDQHLCAVDKKVVWSTNWEQPFNGTETVVGNDVWIGHGAKIMAGVTIGDGAIIGAHAVVAKDVKPFSVIIGNPGKVHRYRFSKEQIKALLVIEWWNWKEEKISKAREDMKDVDKFITKYAKSIKI